MLPTLTALAALVGGVATAEPPMSNELDIIPISVAIAPAAPDSLAMGGALGKKDLVKLEGGDGVLNLGDLQSNTANNGASSANNSVSGNITTGVVSNTDIHDVMGFTTVLQNTGNNVIMQNVTQVNIILK